MDSDADMFLSQGTEGTQGSQGPREIPETQETEGSSQLSKRNKSAFQYGYLVLFDRDPKASKPFDIFSTDDFSCEEIKNSWIEFQLTPKARVKKLKPLEILPGKDMSLFAKIEKGNYYFFYYYYNFYYIFFLNYAMSFNILY